jgi:hypothetical protein
MEIHYIHSLPIALNIHIPSFRYWFQAPKDHTRFNRSILAFHLSGVAHLDVSCLLLTPGVLLANSVSFLNLSAKKSAFMGHCVSILALTLFCLLLLAGLACRSVNGHD